MKGVCSPNLLVAELKEVKIGVSWVGLGGDLYSQAPTPAPYSATTSTGLDCLEAFFSRPADLYFLNPLREQNLMRCETTSGVRVKDRVDDVPTLTLILR
jgi:hypothetical protein